ncbi:MAG: Stk1 family PASTA domain-containing Ser/Thr kinase [Hespellia sp.]|nr:Stk1 family PASTA domain-containing Ser/Thr kinase [Hespellia sp.]
MLKEGVFLGKRYEILERIGSGGMADVYKGRDHKLNRLVAIKVLKSDYRTDEVFIAKFQSEAQAAAGLMHPNVVNVYDVGEDRGLHYMVMELVEGITLKDYIEKKGRLTAKETISIAIQMVTGIEAAHKHHIVHRDIKPQNIIISKEGKVKVTDFGIARAATTSNTISSNVMGSVHYTSPEQARGGAVDQKSDLYSAGITMYEMITGHVPFDGDSTVTIAIKQLQEEITPPSEEVPDIPYSLECIILKCTQKSPEKRYATAQELILNLKRSLVDPEGSFAALTSPNSGSETVMVTPEEMSRIQRQADYDDDDYDDEDDDDYDDYDYDDYDDELDDEEDEEEELEEDVNPKMRKIMKILMAVVAVIIAFIVLFMVGKATGIFKTLPKFNTTTSSDTVKVPDVVGKKEEDAITALNDKSLGYKKSTAASDKYDKGVVMEQKTAAGTKVAKNTQIEIVVSTGKSVTQVTVPDVTGQTEDVAQKTLVALNLTVNSSADYSDSVDEGKVISTDPPSGRSVNEGTTVNMVVSLGAKKPDKVSVPSLQGLSREDASAALSDVGLSLGSVSTEYSDSVAEGSVISQGVSSGKKVEQGTSVDVVISKGPKTVMISVPSLSGMTEEEAGTALSNAGLSVGSVSYEHSSSVTAGYVISQTASSGSQVEEGSSVGFVISLGAEEEKPVDEGNTDTEPTDSPIVTE